MTPSASDEYASIIKQFRIASVLAAVVLGGGMVFYHFVEDLSWLDAFYFCMITLTTIGYGDIVPTTDVGKLFTSFYALMGIGIIAAFANLLLKRAIAKRLHHIEEKKIPKKVPAKK